MSLPSGLSVKQIKKQWKNDEPADRLPLNSDFIVRLYSEINSLRKIRLLLSAQYSVLGSSSALLSLCLQFKSASDGYLRRPSDAIAVTAPVRFEVVDKPAR